MRLAAALSCLLLAGCATPYDPTPDIRDVTDAAAVAKDTADCAKYAAQYHRPLSVSGVVAQGGQGMGSSLGNGVVGGSTFSPLGPLLGGAGGILVGLFQYAGLIDLDTPRAAQACVRQRLDRDHAGILVEAPL